MAKELILPEYVDNIHTTFRPLTEASFLVVTGNHGVKIEYDPNAEGVGLAFHPPIQRERNGKIKSPTIYRSSKNSKLGDALHVAAHPEHPGTVSVTLGTSALRGITLVSHSGDVVVYGDLETTDHTTLTAYAGAIVVDDLVTRTLRFRTPSPKKIFCYDVQAGSTSFEETALGRVVPNSLQIMQLTDTGTLVPAPKITSPAISQAV